MEIHLIPAFTDNYIHLLRDPVQGAVGVVDAGEEEPVVLELERRGWPLTHIFCTHHHDDHIGANPALKRRYGATVIAAEADRARIKDIDIAVGDGDTVAFGAESARVIAVPGHTLGHLAYHFADARALFCGDTLFSLGCGRLFEGTAAQMWDSLSRLAALPAETRVYCGHEYTAANARFAVTIEPQNPDLAARVEEVSRLRAADQPTIPSTIDLERRTNPFLRADQASLQAALGGGPRPAAEIFAEIRRRKDHF